MKKIATTAVDLVQRLELRQLHQADEVQRAQALQALFVRYDLSAPDPLVLVSEVTLLLEDDPAFRRSLTAQLPAFEGNTITAGGSITATGSVIAGRDVTGSNNTDNSRKKTSFGGILVTVVAVAALFLVGKSVITNLITGEQDGSSDGSPPVLTGSNTCRDFLAADQSTQLATLKRIYLDAGNAERAGDPFILQNGQYTCGQAPNMKLASLARR